MLARASASAARLFMYIATTVASSMTCILTPRRSSGGRKSTISGSTPWLRNAMPFGVVPSVRLTWPIE